MSEEERAVMTALANALRRVQWVDNEDCELEATCAYCENAESEGHAPWYCAVGIALARYAALPATPPSSTTPTPPVEGDGG